MKFFFVTIDDVFTELPEKEAYLSDVELVRYGTMTSEKRRKEFLVGRFVLRQQLRAQGFPQAEVLVDARGKPYIEGGLHFNLSHSRDMLLLVLAEEEVGADIEYVRPRTNMDELMTVFEPSLVDAYHALPDVDKPLFFYTHWTQKEAYIKLTQARFYSNVSEDNTVSITTHQHPAGYVYSIARKIKRVSTPSR